jgi:hypothetical protein
MDHKITWLELYNFLYERANDIKNLGSFDWSEPVTIESLNSGNKFFCTKGYIKDKKFNLLTVIGNENENF